MICTQPILEQNKKFLGLASLNNIPLVFASYKIITESMLVNDVNMLSIIYDSITYMETYNNYLPIVMKSFYAVEDDVTEMNKDLAIEQAFYNLSKYVLELNERLVEKIHALGVSLPEPPPEKNPDT